MAELLIRYLVLAPTTPIASNTHERVGINSPPHREASFSILSWEESMIHQREPTSLQFTGIHLVASSRMSILGSLSRALAIATRCFCPPESITPRSPTKVSRPSGKPWMKLEEKQKKMVNLKGTNLKWKRVRPMGRTPSYAERITWVSMSKQSRSYYVYWS